MKPSTAALFASCPAVARAQHPELDNALRRAVRKGEIVAVLPGVYALPDAASAFETRVAAAAVAAPRPVILGWAAAKLTFWPEIEELGPLRVSCRLVDQPGFTFTRTAVPARLQRRLATCVVSSRPLTALELASATGGESIDRALRSGARLLELRNAHRLMTHVPGFAERGRWLEESRDQPWSAAERTAHSILRPLDGWVANRRVCTDIGDFFLDIAFDKVKVDVEVDGYGFHGTEQAFYRDRTRDAALARAGWQVVRFAASTVRFNPATVLATVSAAVKVRCRGMGG